MCTELGHVVAAHDLVVVLRLPNERGIWQALSLSFKGSIRKCKLVSPPCLERFEFLPGAS